MSRGRLRGEPSALRPEFHVESLTYIVQCTCFCYLTIVDNLYIRWQIIWHKMLLAKDNTSDFKSPNTHFTPHHYVFYCTYNV